MDLDEGWELIPEEGYLEIHDDGGKKIYSRKYSGGSSKSFIQRNYFICPPESSLQFVEKTISKSEDEELLKRESAKIPVEIKIMPPVASETIKSIDVAADQDPVSQVFFKKMETEIIEIKVESPRSGRGVMPQIEGGGAFQFEEQGEPGSEMAIDKNYKLDLQENGEGELNLWKWGLTGIGAICCFGMAAATVCIIVLGSGHKNKHFQQKHKLQFQAYANDKRIKQAVQHSSRINEAIIVARGVAITRARITVGGQYDAAAI